MARQEFEHITIEQPRLLQLADMTSAGKNVQFAIGNACLQIERFLVNGIFCPGQNYRWAIDIGMMTFRFGLPKRFELVNDRL